MGATAAAELYAELESIASSVDDDEDPSVYLLRGQKLLLHSCYSEAILEFSCYCRRVPESKLGRAFLEKGLSRVGWEKPSEEEIDQFFRLEPVRIQEKADYLLLDE